MYACVQKYYPPPPPPPPPPGLLHTSPFSTIAVGRRSGNRSSSRFLSTSAARHVECLSDDNNELLVPSQGKGWKGSSIPFDILLAHYEVVLKDASFLQRWVYFKRVWSPVAVGDPPSRLHWECLIVDEGHRLKNSSSLLHRALREVVRRACLQVQHLVTSLHPLSFLLLLLYLSV